MSLVGLDVEPDPTVEELAAVDIEATPEDPSTSWRPLEPVRNAVDHELGTSGRRLISAASERHWTARARLAVGIGPQKRLIKGENGEKGRFVVEDLPIVSLQIRLVSPFGDVAVFLWVGGKPENGWASRAGGPVKALGHAEAKRWVLGPWEEAMEHTGFVPAWKRAKIDEAKAKARLSVCPACGAAVIVGIDQSGGERVATVDVDPLPIVGATLLAEVALTLSKRGVYTLMPIAGGRELYWRTDFHAGERQWPIHVEHICGRPLRIAA